MDIESSKNCKWLKWVPVAALTVSTVSFIFAVVVLYPWHLELSREFAVMQDTCFVKETPRY